MMSRKRLRLKRAVTRAKEDRLGIRSNKGLQVSRLVIHLGSKICEQEVQE